jgi:hypothetical protein
MFDRTLEWPPISSMFRIFPLLITVVCVFGLTGCRNDGLVTLEGMVTVDGKPAPAGICLSFNPVAGGSPSYGQTDDKGRFVANFTHNRKGIEKGEHLVKMMPGGGGASAGRMPEPGEQTPLQRGPATNSAFSFPRSYYQEIMKISVTSNHNEVDIPLNSEK